MSPALWVKVSDEVGLPAELSAAEQARLASVFDSANPTSAWSRALARLGLPMPEPAPPVLRFVRGVPFFNGSLLAWVSSQGTVEPYEGQGGEVLYRSRLGLFGIFRVMRAQWRLEMSLKAFEKIEDPLEESIALGIAIQALVQRLPASSETETAAWLAAPAAAPAPLRPTLSKLLVLQKRRNELSKAWAKLFPSSAPPASGQDLPPHFWNEPPVLSQKPEVAGKGEPLLGNELRGIPIGPGLAEGRLLLVDDHAAPFPSGDSFVLLFPKARPETTELFGRGVAVLFAEGGALSHACSVAREQGIVCVSGLGRGLVEAARLWQRERKKILVRVDGGSGQVFCSEMPD